jgi:hypothetical protein
VQNKANSLIADCGFWIADSESLRPAAWGRAGRLCRQTQLDRAKCAKRTQFAAGAQEWARAGGAERLRRGAIVQNEPNSRRCRVGRGRRGGGRGINAQNEPNLPGRGRAVLPRPSPLRPRTPRRRRLCKTNPIPGQPGGWGHSIVQNKANLPAVIRALSAFEKGGYRRKTPMVPGVEQSQFGGVKFEVSSGKSKKATAEASDFKLHTRRVQNKANLPHGTGRLYGSTFALVAAGAGGRSAGTRREPWRS